MWLPGLVFGAERFDEVNKVADVQALNIACLKLKPPTQLLQAQHSEKKRKDQTSFLKMQLALNWP